ncbi:MAG: 2-phospho-L-lactate transferase [Candidatus Bathyarchaeota archaeon]|nr:2-phospho-L-lactate transferase [Candidatus Bathyarchaeota archaeon]
MITALAGGVGAAKFLSGLVKIVSEEELTIIVNTGDDIEFFGLHISPDLDIVAYTLAGIVDEEKGWGIKGDTFHCLDMLRRYGYETWFNLGDRDLATHIHRTALLRSGLKLSQVTKDICKRLGLKVNILPMTDDRFETWIETDAGLMHFQEYLVKRGAKDRVLGVKYMGMENASPAEGVIDSILESDLIIVCPSNPIVSIGTILSVKGVRESLRRSRARKVAISPIVSGAPIKGPADKLMSGLGLEVSAFSVAYLYRDFLDIFVLDQLDEKERERIESLGIKTILTNTIMRALEDKINLAKTVLEASRSI